MVLIWWVWREGSQVLWRYVGALVRWMGGMFVALTVVERNGQAWRVVALGRSSRTFRGRSFVDTVGRLGRGRFAQSPLKRQQWAM